MIVIKLMGGLGNQMFQYALGKKLAKQHQTNLGLELSFYKKGASRRALKNSWLLLKGLFTKDGLRKALMEIKQDKRQYDLKYFLLDDRVKKLNKTNLPIVKETKEFCFNPELLNSGDDLAYDGYFNTSKYFEDIADLIRADFKLKEIYRSTLPPELIEKIKASQSVSVHIRRGDYARLDAVKKFHGLCDLDYYERAAKLIQTKLTNPIFFIFSDDINWCKNNLHLKAEMIFMAERENYQDLYLMSLCWHNIIANSTFSWWGAWLNDNPNKIVIAPKRWLVNPQIETTDLLPDNWLKI